MATNHEPHTLVSTFGCSRCNGDHENLRARPFAKRVSGVYNHWAMCPTTGDPILLYILPRGQIIHG